MRGAAAPAFAAFALALASLGIYGVMSYSVSRRKQEIGIRMALGTSAGRVRAGVFMQIAKLALIGMILGAVGAWLAAQALQGLLFGVRFSDPVTFGAVLAGYLPARRPSRMDPQNALRAE